MGLGKLGLFSLLSRRRPLKKPDDKVAKSNSTEQLPSLVSTGSIHFFSNSQSAGVSPSAKHVTDFPTPYGGEGEHSVAEYLSDSGVYYGETRSNGNQAELLCDAVELGEGSSNKGGPTSGSECGNRSASFEVESIGFRRSRSDADLSRCEIGLATDADTGCHNSDPEVITGTSGMFEFPAGTWSACSEGGGDAWMAQPTLFSPVLALTSGTEDVARFEGFAAGIDQDRSTTSDIKVDVDGNSPISSETAFADVRQVTEGSKEYLSEAWCSARPASELEATDWQARSARSAPEMYGHAEDNGGLQERPQKEASIAVAGVISSELDASEKARLLKVALSSGQLSGGAMARVSEWVSQLTLAESLPPDDIDVELPVEEPPTLSLSPAHAKRSALSGQLAALGSFLPSNEACILEAGLAGTIHDIDVEYANRCARALDRTAAAANISSRALKVVPSLALFHYLKSLCLSHNAIGRLHGGTLPRSLHTLDLSHNRLIVVEGLRDLTRLRVLNLSHNRLSRIGHGLASCTSLRELYLAGNKISEIEGLHRLLKLVVLDLGDNKLTSTKAISQLAANYGSMRALNLAGNPIHVNLGEDAFRRFISGLLPHLIYLNNAPVKTLSAREVAADGVRAALGASQGRSSRVSARATSVGKKAGGGHHRSAASSVRGSKSSTAGSARPSGRQGSDRSDRPQRRSGNGSFRDEGQSKAVKRTGSTPRLLPQVPAAAATRVETGGGQTLDVNVGNGMVRSSSMSLLQA